MNVSHLQVKCSFSSEQIYLSWSISEKQSELAITGVKELVMF